MIATGTKVEGVLAKVIETPTRKRLEVLPGQGRLGVYMIYGDSSKRQSFANGNVVKVDIDTYGDVMYYKEESEPILFADSINDPKVNEYINTHKTI